MTDLRADRLLALARFLDRLPADRFDFGSVRNESACGTVACAIGWTPEIFPELVRPNEIAGVCTPAGEYKNYTSAAWMLFGVPRIEAWDLFSPTYKPWDLPWYRTESFDRVPSLGHRAPPGAVATSIRDYLRWKGVDVEAEEAALDRAEHTSEEIREAPPAEAAPALCLRRRRATVALALAATPTEEIAR